MHRRAGDRGGIASVGERDQQSVDLRWRLHQFAAHLAVGGDDVLLRMDAPGVPSWIFQGQCADAEAGEFRAAVGGADGFLVVARDGPSEGRDQRDHVWKADECGDRDRHGIADQPQPPTPTHHPKKRSETTPRSPVLREEASAAQRRETALLELVFGSYGDVAHDEAAAATAAAAAAVRDGTQRRRLGRCAAGLCDGIHDDAWTVRCDRGGKRGRHPANDHHLCHGRTVPI